MFNIDGQRGPPTYSTVMDNSIPNRLLTTSITNPAAPQLPSIIEPSFVDEDQSLEVPPTYEEATSRPNSRRNSIDIDAPSYEVAISQPNSRRSSFVNLEVPASYEEEAAPSQPNSRKSSINIDVMESF